MGLATLFRKLGAENGIEIPDDELEALGLSDDESGTEHAAGDDFDLDAVLAGEASGAVELFLSDPVSMLADGKPVESDGLMWEPIIREGQWAVRPGARGQKVRRPLKVVAGHSKDQRKEIGLADILDAHADNAVEHVTVPTSHDNLVTQNTGFIKGLKIVKAKVKDAKTKADKTVAVLMGGYDIRKKDIKESMLDGSIASRSAGLLYDYVNTETGRQYPVVLEHVALTNKPWITGMKAFGRKLVKPLKPVPVGLSLSDEEPTEAELLSSDDALDGIELADSSVTWDKEDDPDWLRSRVNMQLDEARAKKIADIKAKAPIGAVVYDSYNWPIRYRCVKARPGLALVADGWGDEANCWTAPFKVVGGDVELDTDLSAWTASKRVYIPDDARKEFEPGTEPLSEAAMAEKSPLEGLTGLGLAQARRRVARQNKTEGAKPPVEQTTTTPRGGEHMAGDNGTLQLSDEAQRLISEARADARKAQDEAAELRKQFSSMFSDHATTKADEFISHLKSIGLDEERGFAGALVEIRELMLADDGGEAVQGEKFADDSNAEGTLTLSQAIRRIFKAIELGEDGKIKLAQTITPPTTTTTEETKTEGGEAKVEVKLGTDGKPLPEGEEKDFTELSEDEQLSELREGSPEMFEMLRLASPAVGANGNGSKGGE